MFVASFVLSVFFYFFELDLKFVCLWCKALPICLWCCIAIGFHGFIRGYF